MSDSDYGDTQDDEPQPKRNFRRELEDRATQAEQEAAQLRRENAIFKAGLTNLTERQIRLLATEVGDNLTPEAITSAAQELGWAQAPKEEAIPADELAAFDRAASASNGAISAPPVDPVAAMEQALQEGGMEAFMARASEMGLPTTWEQQ